MPNTKSAKKRLRQDQERRVRHRAVKSALRSQIRKVHEAIQAGDPDKAATEMREVAKRLDRAGAHRVIHPNKAARTKSRLEKRIRLARQANSA